jgi:ribosomal small subunit protein bTHX
MGKGDRKTRRGKIYRGSFGRSRAKDPRKRRKQSARGSELARKR